MSNSVQKSEIKSRDLSKGDYVTVKIPFWKTVIRVIFYPAMDPPPKFGVILKYRSSDDSVDLQNIGFTKRRFRVNAAYVHRWRDLDNPHLTDDERKVLAQYRIRGIDPRPEPTDV